MALLLRKQGIRRIRPLQGGLDAWRKLGYPVQNIEAIAVSAPPAVDDGVAEPRQEIDAIDEHGRAIEEKLAAAERESAALARELSSLDEAWSEKIDELAEAKSAVAAGPGEAAEPHETAQKPRAATNVVPLAARIKAIQRDASR